MTNGQCGESIHINGECGEIMIYTHEKWSTWKNHLYTERQWRMCRNRPYTKE